MKKYLLLLLFSPISFLFAQNEIRKTNIDLTTFGSQLSNSPNEINIGIGKTQQSTNIISLPFSDGSYGDFKMVEYSILPKGVETDIKTFYGQKVDDNSISCRISLTKNWIVATIYTKNGIVVVEKSKQSVNINEYDVYLQSQNEFECKAENSINAGGRLRDIEGILNYTNGANLRTYRMAIMVTNEFYTDRGNTDATINAEVTAIINSLNGLYEKELAVRFTLVSPNNPVSSNVFYRKTTDIATYNQDVDIIRIEMNTRYGTTNYDLGHCLHTTGGGVAYYGVCNNTYKGGGWSGSTTPSSILLMAHEVGHQFTAPHTFLGNGNSNCSDGNRSLSTAYEPASGNTIMSYAELCGAGQNITGGKVPYFHTNSLQNMISYIQSGTGNTCGTPTSNGNTPPVVVAGTAITIPKNTPFTLIGSGTDANGDVLTYTWEQYDLPVANDVGALGSSTNGVGGYAAINSTTAPLFRSTQSSSPERVFPSLSGILNNANNPADTEGEDLPNVSRTMNFRLTARDNRAGGGGVDSDEILVTVSANGPLSVAIPNGTESLAASSSQTITWNVNSTNSLAANVNILLSIDGGNTFPFTLATNTPNDGSQAVTLPNLPASTQGRIKIVANLNASATFFDISDANFTITSTCNAFSSYVCPSTDLSATQGAASLNLALSAAPKASSPILSKSMTITTATVTPVIGYTDAARTTCTSLSTYYTTVFAFRVSKTGTYTLTNSTGGFLIMSVHNANTSLSCSNFLGGNAHTDTGVWVTSSMSLTLNECTDYYLYVCNFSTSGTYSVGFSGAGDVFEKLSTPAGIAYTYAAISNTDNLIKVVSATGNFTTLAPDTYTVYGISYDNTLNTSTFVGQTLTAIIGGTNCLFPSNNNKKITVTCTSSPSAPTATGGSRCGTGTVSLSATGCAGTYNWYASSTGGSSLGTGSPFITPSILTTTTYYVDCTVSGCPSASRSSAIATVNTAPSVPTVAGAGSCLNSPVTLTASGCAGTYNWYTALTGGALLTSGASLTGLTSSGTYYVDCTVGTCVSSRASGTITVKPAAPSVAGVTILSGQTATLTATGCSGTVKWYASATGTAVSLTGTSYTTTALTINTTYYADCTVSSCTSGTRTAAIVTISSCPSTLTLVSTADDIASGNITKQASATVSAAPNANIIATNKVTGVGTRATYQAKSILLNPGFKADSGTIFKAEIGGCN